MKLSRASVLRIGVCLVLTALVWVLFGQTRNHQFVNYDDVNYVLGNPHINTGLSWENVGWAFTHVHSQNWHPLTSISHMLDVQLFGLNPGRQHLVNVLLHGLSAVLLFLLLQRTTNALWASAFVAAMFAVHPLRVESVAWISERKDVLSGLFFMLTLWSYISYAERRSVSRYLTTTFFLACGLMSKPMLVTTPLVLLLLDYWPLERVQMIEAGGPTPEFRQNASQLLSEKIPFCLLSAGSVLATLWAQSRSIGTTDQLPIKWRLSNAVFSYFEYLRQTFWPHDLIPFYIHPEGRLEFWKLALSVATIALITVAAWLWRSRRKYLLVGWLWYLIMLLPVIGIVQVSLQGKADRYTYLPQIGLLLALTWLVRDLTAAWRHRELVLGPAALAVIGTTSILTWKQAEIWQDSETLWQHTLSITPDNDVAHTGLAGIYYATGRLDQAIEHYREAVRRRPGNGAAQSGLATALVAQHKFDEAVEHFEKAMEVGPDNLQASNALALLYVQRGQAADAAKQWENTLRFEPNDFDAANNLSWLLSTATDPTLGNPARALELAKRAAKLANERSPAVYRTLAVAYGENHLFPEGIVAAQEGIRLSEKIGSKGATSDLQKCIEAFQNGKTWREVAPIRSY